MADELLYEIPTDCQGLPRTKGEALAIGAKFYFTGRPCLRGHVSRRRVYRNGGACLECERRFQKPVVSDEERFWSFVAKGDKDECWEWTGGHNKAGYGRISIGNERMLAHRVGWQFVNGLIEDSEICVLHKCDNPPCCNPHHLFLGGNLDNHKDMMSKNRGSKPPVRVGEKNNKAKLTKLDVIYIRLSDKNGQELAEELGLVRSTVNRIRAGKLWKHAE